MFANDVEALMTHNFSCTDFMILKVGMLEPS